MYVYMYNIDWIRARKIRVFHYPFKLCEIVNYLGNWRRRTPPYLVHITVRPELVAVKLIDCDVSHKANWWLCRELTRWNYQEWVRSSRYGPWRAVQGSPGRVGWVRS